MENQLAKIVRPLLRWYAENARTLPWRDEPTPYRVWVSEIMLQQTRVEAVKPYFERFTAELPDIPSLANAPEEQLLKLWEGLGYYSRVRNLQKAAQEVLKNYGGILPRKPEELLRLPGIGEYTAGAIASIAYGEPTPAVDGNVLRVIARVSADPSNISETAVKREFAGRLREIYPREQAGAFTQALMELGAMVCLPNAEPKCEKCPLSSLCAAHTQGIERDFPIKAAKKQRKIEERTVFLILHEGKAAIQKRPAKGLLAGLWEFPGVLGKLSPQKAEEQLKTWGVTADKIVPIEPSKHIFSHIEWNMTNYLVSATKAPESGTLVWADLHELSETYTIPAAFGKCLAYFRRMQIP